ncbi:hypothetical protein ACPYOC_16460 [Ornithinimicrobium sp. W1665]|uniref:hypothetical protein n=2 Tax=Ornithinimicrobium sp. W1665 TaxID=3416666 RepID=UPI003CFB48BF
MSAELHWDVESMDYISSRSSRYADALDIDPDWTRELLADADMVALEPDPKSRMGASRFIGRSPSAGRVLVLIAYRDLDGELHGVNAWPATGADLQIYQEGLDDGQDC